MTDSGKDSWSAFLKIFSIIIGILLTVISSLILSKLDYIEQGLKDYYTFKFQQVQKNILMEQDIKALQTMDSLLKEQIKSKR